MERAARASPKARASRTKAGPSHGNVYGRHMVVSPNYGYHVGGPYNKDCSILGSILGSPYFGKLPYSRGFYVCLREVSATGTVLCQVD